jgi:hypothetical protein
MGGTMKSQTSGFSRDINQPLIIGKPKIFSHKSTLGLIEEEKHTKLEIEEPKPLGNKIQKSEIFSPVS